MLVAKGKFTIKIFRARSRVDSHGVSIGHNGLITLVEREQSAGAQDPILCEFFGDPGQHGSRVFLPQQQRSDETPSRMIEGERL